jgi:hypothetical protein
MPKIPPLPPTNDDGNCPWCGVSLLDRCYEADDVQRRKTCPECEKPIQVHFHEQTTFTLTIVPKRSPADLLYLKSLGLTEAGTPNG